MTGREAFQNYGAILLGILLGQIGLCAYDNHDLRRVCGIAGYDQHISTRSGPGYCLSHHDRTIRLIRVDSLPTVSQ